MLLNDKLPTIVGILTLMSIINTYKHGNTIYECLQAK